MSAVRMHPRPPFSLRGGPKAGATTAYALLAQQPDICMSSVKETDHFQQDQKRRLQWFESLFAHRAGEAARGEASPRDVVEPEAPTRMFATNPEMSVIFILIIHAVIPLPEGAYRLARNSVRRVRNGSGKDSRSTRLLMLARRGVPRSLMCSETNTVERMAATTLIICAHSISDKLRFSSKTSTSISPGGAAQVPSASGAA